MQNPRRKAGLLAGLLALAAIVSSAYVVPEGQQAVLTQFGKPFGKPVADAGLHFRIPFVQKVHQVDLQPAFENSLVLAPLYPRYVHDSEETFAQQATELRTRIGTGRHVLLGFATFLDIQFPSVDLEAPISSAQMAPALDAVDTIVERARKHGLVAHISLMSGFFHGWNALRERAIRDDVRNAQWFADGLIAPEADLNDPHSVPRSAWVTPSRHAASLRARIEEGTRMLGERLAARMAEFPETLVTISGDGEVEYTYERNFLASAERVSDSPDIIYADYSPFMVAEFRDEMLRVYGDDSPATDSNGDGRMFNRDFRQNYTTWKLRYYDQSGPIPLDEYSKLPEKLPSSGRHFTEGGFDAPRQARPGDTFWEAWMRFRKQALARWVSDFATWVTGSADPKTGFTIPPSRYYTHQIPADFLFGSSDSRRLQTSASFLETAFADPLASSGVTAFNVFNRGRHAKTADRPLFAALVRSADHWGILEYNPSVPPDDSSSPSPDENYYFAELEELYRFRPHVIVPFAWSDLPEHRRYRIQGTAFERGLRRFVESAGDSPWLSLRKVAW